MSSRILQVQVKATKRGKPGAKCEVKVGKECGVKRKSKSGKLYTFSKTKLTHASEQRVNAVLRKCNAEMRRSKKSKK
jgi:hypothetical protein